MENNTIDIDDESSECEEIILKSRIVNYESDIETEDENKINNEMFDTLEDMIILEISLTQEDFNLLKDNKIIIGDGEECILILNDLIKNCKNRDLEDNISNHKKNKKDKFKFIHGFIMGLIYSKYIKK